MSIDYNQNSRNYYYLVLSFLVMVVIPGQTFVGLAIVPYYKDTARDSKNKV